MFENKSYFHELTSLHTPVHEDVRTLAYFSLNSGGNASANTKALINLSTCDINTLLYL
ncbi:hypothetical protein MTR_5g054610 [Medicago truncatula]|uniref:Uncharacterized protein n=1 Tax=Medicago truncatula TaxID=3880 RepID=G7JYD2_MEDTR|nr:hypothetical protein MTR_5g054610 [Medicago truncatula]